MKTECEDSENALSRDEQSPVVEGRRELRLRSAGTLGAQSTMVRNLSINSQTSFTIIIIVTFQYDPIKVIVISYRYGIVAAFAPAIISTSASIQGRRHGGRHIN